MDLNNNFKFEKLFLTSFYENPNIFLNRINNKKFSVKKAISGFIKEKELNFTKSSKLNIRLKNLTKQLFNSYMTYRIISSKKKMLKRKIAWVWGQNFQIYNDINNRSLLFKKWKKIKKNLKCQKNLVNKLKTKPYSIENLFKSNKAKLLLFFSSKKTINYPISKNIYKTYFLKNNIFHFQTCCLKKNKLDFHKLLFLVDFFITETQLKVIKLEKNNCFQNQEKLKKLYFKNSFFYLLFIPFSSLFYKINFFLFNNKKLINQKQDSLWNYFLLRKKKSKTDPMEKKFLKINQEEFYFQLDEFFDFLKNSKNGEFKRLILATKYIKNLFPNKIKKFLKIFIPDFMIGKGKIKESQKYIINKIVFKFFQKQNNILNFVIKQFLIRNLFYFFSLSSPSSSIYPINTSSTGFSFLSPKSWFLWSERDSMDILSQKRILESKNYFLFSKILPINNWNKFYLICLFQKGPQYNCQSYNQNLIQEVFLVLSRNEKILIQTYSFIFEELFQNSISNIFKDKFSLKNHNFKQKHIFFLSENHIFFQNMQITIYEKYIEESIFNFISKKLLKFQVQLFFKKKYFDTYIQKNRNLVIFRGFKENLFFKRINYIFISKKNIFLFGTERLWYSFLFLDYFNNYFKKYELLKKYQKFYFSHSFLSFKNQKNGLDFLGFNFKYLTKKTKNLLFVSKLNKKDLNKFILIKKNFIKKPIFKKYKLLEIIYQLDFFLNLIENLIFPTSNFFHINFQKNFKNYKKKDYFGKFIYFNKQKIFLNSFFLNKSEKKILMNNFFYKIDFYFSIESILFKGFFDFKLIILPSKENIRLHLQKIKNTIKKSTSKPQKYLINKLSDNIKTWSFNYKMIFQNFFKQKQNNQIYKVLSYCDYITFKYLWNWACRRHPNKSKKWIKEKYFNYVENKKWIFSQFNSSTKSLLILRKH